MGKVLSCFATERKHNDVTLPVAHVFTDVEHAIIFGYRNRYVQDVIDGQFQFGEQYISTSHRRRNIDLAGAQIGVAVGAQLQCARVKADDSVLFGSCGALRLGR
eukprot:4114059-Pyramimonas_sp.AAC.1